MSHVEHHGVTQTEAIKYFPTTKHTCRAADAQRQQARQITVTNAAVSRCFQMLKESRTSVDGFSAFLTFSNFVFNCWFGLHKDFFLHLHTLILNKTHFPGT